MIGELAVANVALIRRAELEPSEGLTVITGETGSGKTALLEGLKLLAGVRGQASAVRDGERALRVEGRIYTDDDAEEGHVVVRSLNRQGRGRVTIDGSMATVAELAEGIGRTVDLCGQHEHQRLLYPAAQLALVDEWGGEAIAGPLEAWKAALRERRVAARELRAILRQVQASDERVSEAEFTCNRIDAVDPKPGELDELRETLRIAEHADALLQAVEGARSALVADGGVSDGLASATGLLRGVEGRERAIAQSVEALETAAATVEDVAQTLRSFAESVDLDPARLLSLQERQAALQGLIRSYGPTLDDVLAKRDAARELLETARDGAGREKRARQGLRAAEGRLVAAADDLDKARLEVGERLCREVSSQLGRLGMAGAEVIFSLDRQPRNAWGPSGPSSVAFLYRSAPGLTPRPLAKVASGGELSRVMLAIKVVQGAGDSADTIVFDEVDAGVGGQAALDLANVIADLAETHQVLCVTHLPQVAVAADTHYVVTKETLDDSGIPETQITEVTGEKRVDEIARMLAGDVTETSRAHARELLGP